MIVELMSLETLHGYEETTFYMDEMIKYYAFEEIKHALEKGDIHARKIYIGPDCGRVLCWLSEKGRRKAEPLLH